MRRNRVIDPRPSKRRESPLFNEKREELEKVEDEKKQNEKKKGDDEEDK